MHDLLAAAEIQIKSPEDEHAERPADLEQLKGQLACRSKKPIFSKRNQGIIPRVKQLKEAERREKIGYYQTITNAMTQSTLSIEFNFLEQ